MKRIIALLALTLTTLATDLPVVQTQVIARVEPQWLPLRPVGTNGVRSVGFITTNAYALVIHDGRTNVVFLKQLGQEPFPSLHATNRVEQGAPQRLPGRAERGGR